MRVGLYARFRETASTLLNAHLQLLFLCLMLISLNLRSILFLKSSLPNSLGFHVCFCCFSDFSHFETSPVGSAVTSKRRRWDSSVCRTLVVCACCAQCHTRMEVSLPNRKETRLTADWRGGYSGPVWTRRVRKLLHECQQMVTEKEQNRQVPAGLTADLRMDWRTQVPNREVSGLPSSF